MMFRRYRPARAVPHRRRGTLYVGVMATATIVAVVGLSGLSVAHLGVRSAQNLSSADTAALLARAAVEEGARNLISASNWRTQFSNNVEYPNSPLSLNGGTMSWKYVDSDGNFTNNAADGVRVYGIGRSGGATYVESVLLQPTGTGLTCLEVPFHCNGNITLAGSCDLTTQQVVSSNGSIDATALLAVVNGNAEAVGTITGTVQYSKTTGITPRQMPGNTAFDYYLANGTWIDITSLPLSSGSRMIAKKVFSPTLNPFGATDNAEGIYVIDCQGQDLKIENSRIIGTLVLINPGSTCQIQWSMTWNPVSPNYPALLVQGNAQFAMSETDLKETTVGANFNPPGAPYNGVTDNDQSDLLPSKIKGLVYVSGQIKFPNSLVISPFDGSVICSTVLFESSGDAKFTYRPTHIHYPPPGFATGNAMQVVPGTWKRSSLP